MVLTNVLVDTEGDCVDGGGDETDTTGMLCCGADDAAELGSEEADGKGEGEAVGVAAAAPPRKGVGTTVEFGLGGGIPPG